MTTTDRTRLLRGVGLALAAVLLVGGSVLGSHLGSSGDSQPGQDSIASPSDSADDQGIDQNGGASEVEDASESPEASPEADETNDASESETEDASESAEPSESPDASGSPEASADESHSGEGGGSDD